MNRCSTAVQFQGNINECHHKILFSNHSIGNINPCHSEISFDTHLVGNKESNNTTCWRPCIATRRFLDIGGEGVYW